MNSEIKIPLNKSKLRLYVLGSIVFVIGGYLMLWNIMGVAAIVFFGATGIYGSIKLFDTKMGLKIDASGITDNTGAMSIGLIEWKDVSAIRTKQVMSTRFLFIDTINPEKYVKKAKNIAQKKLIQVNMNKYETPIAISSNSLSCNFQELENIVLTEFKKHKNTR